MKGYRNISMEELKGKVTGGERIDISGGCKTYGNFFFGYKTESFLAVDMHGDNDWSAEETVYTKKHRKEHRNDARSTARNEMVKNADRLDRYFSDAGAVVFNTVKL